MKYGLLNKIRPMLWLGLCAASLGAGCSNDDSGETSELAAKVTLTLSKYYNDQGATSLVTWKSSDRGAVFAVRHGAAEPAYAAPILPGSQKSLFLFTVDAPAHADATLVGFYPSDAALACEDNTLKATIPATQSGSITPCLVGKATARANSYEGYDIELKQLFCTMYVSVKKGNYSISKAVVKANGGETIAGDISIGIDDGSVNASAQTITVTPPSPIDCTGEARLIPVMIAPVTLSQGYTVTLTDTDGHSFSVGSTDAVTLTAGDKIETDDARSTEVTELIFCGDNMVYMIDAGLADETGYKNAVTWSWDATTAAATLGLAASRCNHLDDCKPVDNGKKLLVTSSYNWCALLDIATGEVLFHTTAAPNAHSAEMLPDNRIAVACSEGSNSNNNKVQVYDIGTSEPRLVPVGTRLGTRRGLERNDPTALRHRRPEPPDLQTERLDERDAFARTGENRADALRRPARHVAGQLQYALHRRTPGIPLRHRRQPVYRNDALRQFHRHQVDQLQRRHGRIVVHRFDDSGGFASLVDTDHPLCHRPKRLRRDAHDQSPRPGHVQGPRHELVSPTQSPHPANGNAARTLQRSGRRF